MGVLETQMLNTCKEQGIDSIRTKHGTIIRSVKSRYWTNDWDSMYDFIEENDAYGLLEKETSSDTHERVSFRESRPALWA
jgi:hypothetical protein